MILKGTIELRVDEETCETCPRWIDYQFDTDGIHTVDIWDCCGQHRKETTSPGEVYTFLADYRDNPEVLQLLNWLM